MIINREDFIAEELIREHVRQRISATIRSRQLAEQQIRSVVRRLLTEAETGTEEPSGNTGINVLADLLQTIIPTVQTDYKMLTTSAEQRDSFRTHIIHAIKNALNPIDTVEDAEDLPESYIFEIDSELLLEKVKIDLDPDEDNEESQSIEGEFIDIDAGDEDDEFIQLDDQNETGRNFAANTFKQIEKQIVDAYDLLADDEDQKLFYDYLITNMLLYFDKFEDELANELPATTTPEYEETKGEDTEGEAPPDEDTEEEDAPAPDEDAPDETSGSEPDLFQ